MSAVVAPLGMTCAWCHTADWMLGERALMSGRLGVTIRDGYAGLFHDRGAAAAEVCFQRSSFQRDAFQTAGVDPRHCWADAVRYAGAV